MATSSDTNLKDRQRNVFHWWDRDPKGKKLPRPPPYGIRTPNDIIWAHSLSDFYWVRRIPDAKNLVTVYSRSMLRELGENYDETKFPFLEPRPRIRRPWPVLKLPADIARTVVDDSRFTPKAAIGVIDEGSDHEGDTTYEIQFQPKEPTHQDELDIDDSEANTAEETSGLGDQSTTNPEAIAEVAKEQKDTEGAVPIDVEESSEDKARESGKANETSGLDDQLTTNPEAVAEVEKKQNDIEGADSMEVDEISEEKAGGKSREEEDSKAGEKLDKGKQPINVSEDSGKDRKCRPVTHSEVSHKDDGLLIPNYTDNPALDAYGKPYKHLWAPQRRVELWNSSPSTMRELIRSTPVYARLVEDRATPEYRRELTLFMKESLLPGRVLNPGSTESPFFDVKRLDANGALGIVSKKVTFTFPEPDKVVNEGSAMDMAVDNPVTVDNLPERLQKLLKSLSTDNKKSDEKGEEAKVTDQQPGEKEEETKVTAPESGKSRLIFFAAPKDSSSEAPGQSGKVHVKASDSTEGAAYVSKKKSKSSDSPTETFYSTKGLPKLEEFIPRKFFPDVLEVHDFKLETMVRADGTVPSEAVSTNKRVFKYKRVYPEHDAKKGDHKQSRVAHLYLSASNKLGVGHHSNVYRAPMRLPEPLSARSPNGMVTVAAKTAFPAWEPRQLLDNEGRIYNQFPKHLQEEWCGYNLVTPIRYPVPVGAVVPKFYGYYVPVEEDAGGSRSFGARRSPILLLEECGVPIEPKKFTEDNRAECFSLLLRLHLEEFLQNSLYVRNILIQPGPLTVRPDMRSMNTPSFRIIDFGRAEHLDKDATETKRFKFGEEKFHEKRRAMIELEFEHKMLK